MRPETIPLILGFLFALLGLGLIIDAWFGPHLFKGKERRRSRRATLSVTSQACLGIGTLSLGFALASRDTGRFTHIAIFVGLAYLIFAIAKSHQYIWQWLTSRGAERRRPADQQTFIGPTKTIPRFKHTPSVNKPVLDPSSDPDLPSELILPVKIPPSPAVFREPADPSSDPDLPSDLPAELILPAKIPPPANSP